MLTRPAGERLRPFVSLLWAQDGFAADNDFFATEMVLPTGHFHLVIRIEGAPAKVGGASSTTLFEPLPMAVIGGARAAPYRRQVRGGGSAVGALLRPGFATALFGVPAGALAGVHVALADVWRPADVAELQGRLAAACGPGQRLAVLERELERRIGAAAGPDPHMPRAARWLAGGHPVAAVVERLGCSHRHFAGAFAEAVGLAPKTFQLLVRFNRVVDLIGGSGQSRADLAAAAGYADQAHMTRDFRTFAGLTPAAYRRLAPVSARHVPLPA